MIEVLAFCNHSLPCSKSYRSYAQLLVEECFPFKFRGPHTPFQFAHAYRSLLAAPNAYLKYTYPINDDTHHHNRVMAEFDQGYCLAVLEVKERK